MIATPKIHKMTITLRDGCAEIIAPNDFPDVNVEVTLERPFNPEVDWIDEEMEEIRQLMIPDPKAGAEVVAMIESGEIDLSR